MKAITINLHDAQAAKLDQAARALGMSQAALARDLLGDIDIAEAGRRRLRQFEALAAQEIEKANAPRPGSTAAAEHLAEHAKLCGFPEETK